MGMEQDWLQPGTIVEAAMWNMAMNSVQCENSRFRFYTVGCSLKFNSIPSSIQKNGEAYMALRNLRKHGKEDYSPRIRSWPQFVMVEKLN